ncbi:DNA-binding transcriptional response regulator, NtrC family, contains REC, AAA-type ATPase, and a Fis-type DNA-binding domains [Desulfacinum hydrothermale DSM 13146]|uniref:DNA-binding transcriptional response regulator, NtrC family, contains REC, AAA-type ATPase, and a Fis-type DNA-binding domains n=1 Tax=Desulfacinum hydrothermale DSM 13146 TaxID=1121390 RepID=A0A1W1X4M2_9BACT|nr:sigma-54 dependent transcriptional regulator [Desulfacinum hydrothermale]SMC18852.1 DNA-binding transcriptional response regulator, NtrC family, contains REC, AAA-type ATPase, and a Fis-type DNA-binding domains [Desulfacinum hydrothermale DSM 13146]
MAANARILVVDDDELVRLSLSNWLKEENYVVDTAADASSAIQAFQDQSWDIVLLDLRIPDGDGIEVLRQIKKIAPQTVVIIMTGFASIESSVSAMKEGAYDYVVKPLDVEQLTRMLRTVVQQRRSLSGEPKIPERFPDRFTLENLIGKSATMQRIFEMIRRVAETNATVLITGETGTGKELVARAIHARSLRRHNPFVPVSCAALPESLLESELFGYEKGAFTGANKMKKGRFELADGGTLFLDEVGEINRRTQVKLLRVLQERELTRLGGTERIDVDVRVISATNRNLPKAVEMGLFRSDLYYRLNVVTLHVPPLRERKEDIPLLAAHFMRKYSLECNKIFDRISPQAMERLIRYDWPGNIRELENVIERAVVIHSGPAIQPGHLPFQMEAAISAEDLSQHEESEPTSLKEVEKRHILKMLDRFDWNVSKTARALEIDRTTLHKKMKRYGFRKTKTLS